jgi:hypothetical protein
MPSGVPDHCIADTKVALTDLQRSPSTAHWVSSQLSSPPQPHPSNKPTGFLEKGVNVKIFDLNQFHIDVLRLRLQALLPQMQQGCSTWLTNPFSMIKTTVSMAQCFSQVRTTHGVHRGRSDCSMGLPRLHDGVWGPYWKKLDWKLKIDKVKRRGYSASWRNRNWLFVVDLSYQTS